VVIAVEAISFALVARRFAGRHGFIPRSERFDHVLEWLTLERVVLPAAVVAMAGVLTVGWCVFNWAVKGFGPLEYEAQLHDLVLGLTAVAVGLQVMLLAFLASIMDIPRQAAPPDESPTPEAPWRPATLGRQGRLRVDSVGAPALVAKEERRPPSGDESEHAVSASRRTAPHAGRPGAARQGSRAHGATDRRPQPAGDA
jgi:hypothetical protein